MPIVLSVAARVPGLALPFGESPAEKAAHRLEELFHEASSPFYTHSGGGKTRDGRTVTHFVIHPGTEDIVITTLDRSRLRIDAPTSQAGPGYHAYLCDLLKQFGLDLKLEWLPLDPAADLGDLTGYFQGGGFENVQREMVKWLQAVLREVLRTQRRDGVESWHLSISARHRYETGGRILTPLGFRDIDWARQVFDRPADGADFFQWWDQGLDARARLGAARYLMWNEMRWCEPRTDDEKRVMAGTDAMLSIAHKEDPSLDYPWREWSELRRYFPLMKEAQALIDSRAAEPDDRPPVGYRRENVTVNPVGGWCITIPGSFSEECDNEGKAKWLAWDKTRNVHLSSFAYDGKPPSAQQLLESYADKPIEGERIDFRADSQLGIGDLTKEFDNGHNYWNLTGVHCVDGRVAVCTVTWHSEEERDWAIETWKSVRCMKEVNERR